MKRMLLGVCAGGVAALIIGGVAIGATGMDPGSRDVPRSASPSVASEVVSRGPLAERVSMKGTLAYANVHDIGTSVAGTVTGVPSIGTVVGRGGELFRVDDRPIPLLYGDLPMWRPFEWGMTAGRDVQQLQQNLAELGYFTREPDQRFDGNTEAAIGAWEKALGLPWTGTLNQGQVVFGPGEVQVASVKAPVGSAAGGAVLSVSSTAKQVAAMADTSLRSAITEGSAVTVSLPGGAQTAGTVTRVGAPVEQENRNGEKALKVPVTVALNDPAVAAQYSDVTVTVSLSRVVKDDALLVPVTALLAQPGGGFAVELESGKGKQRTAKRVAVELGSFAGGMVEVTGGKVKAGDRVVVAQ